MFTNLRSYPHTMGRGAKLALPDGWLVAPLRRLVDVRGGMTPSMARREFWDGGVPWVTPKDMKRPLISDSIDHISTTAIRETSLSLVPASAVLMVVRGMILARHVPIARTLRPATINQDMKALVARPGLLPEFLHYVLIGENLRLLALVSESGHGTRKLETALWREVELALPPADEQAAIVKYLAHAHARIDRAIAAKRKLIALLDEQKQAIIGRAVTRGLDPTAPLKESCIPWLGQVPAHWQVVELKRVLRGLIDCEHKTAPYSPQGVHRVVRTTAVRHGTLNWAGTYPTSTGAYAEWTKRGKPVAGDVIFTREAPAGEACVVPANAEVCLGQRTVLMQVNRTLADPHFLVHQIYAGAPREQIRVATQGSTVGHFNMDDIGWMRVLVPPLAEQEAIVGRLNAEVDGTNRAVERVAAEIALLREFRTRLTSDVVTGQVDVRHIAAALPDLDPEDLTPDVGGSEDDLVDEAAEFLEDVDA